MSLVLYKYCAAALIFILSVIVIIYPIRRRAYPAYSPTLEWADAFASGIFLGAALFHLLPDATILFSHHYGNHYPIAELFAAGGFLLLLFFERLSESLPYENHSIFIAPLVVAVMLMIHSLIEGAALGVNTEWAMVSMMLLAIIAHKTSASFALVVILHRSQMALRAVIALITLFSLMTPIGILIGTILTKFLYIETGQLLTAGFNAFAAGTFLYMSTLHHMNHHACTHHKSENLAEFLFLVIGLLTMAVLALWT